VSTQQFGTRWKEWVIAGALVLLNAVILTQFVGTSNEPFSWQAFAGAYATPSPTPVHGITNVLRFRPRP
jgi:hypothetical protein